MFCIGARNAADLTLHEFPGVLPEGEQAQAQREQFDFEFMRSDKALNDSRRKSRHGRENHGQRAQSERNQGTAAQKRCEESHQGSTRRRALAGFLAGL